MSAKKNKTLRCCKCFVTLDRLKEDKICDYFIKIIDENGKEDFICRVCYDGW